jgi:hypothetical protein
MIRQLEYKFAYKLQWQTSLNLKLRKYIHLHGIAENFFSAPLCYTIEYKDVQKSKSLCILADHIRNGIGLQT